MNKRFFILVLLIASHITAFANNADTKIFIGCGVVTSFNRNNFQSQVDKDLDASKKSLTAYGIQLVTGLTKYLSNNINISIIHESSFLSKATHIETLENNDWYKLYRQTWLPSFGISIGYAFNSVNIGINSGISINRFKYVQDMSLSLDGNDTTKINKNVHSVLPYIGIFMEKKFNRHNLYLNVNHIFKRKRLMSYNYDPSYQDFSIYDKYSSWKVAVGAKYNLKVF